MSLRRGAMAVHLIRRHPPVSFRDCSGVPGGTCGELDDGSLGCIYREGGCDALPACDGDALTICAIGASASAACGDFRSATPGFGGRRPARRSRSPTAGSSSVDTATTPMGSPGTTWPPTSRRRSRSRAIETRAAFGAVVPTRRAARRPAAASVWSPSSAGTRARTRSSARNRGASPPRPPRGGRCARTRGRDRPAARR